MVGFISSYNLLWVIFGLLSHSFRMIVYLTVILWLMEQRWVRKLVHTVFFLLWGVCEVTVSSGIKWQPACYLWQAKACDSGRRALCWTLEDIEPFGEKSSAIKFFLWNDSAKSTEFLTMCMWVHTWTWMKVEVKVAQSHLTFVTPQTIQSMEFSRPESWSG